MGEILAQELKSNCDEPIDADAIPGEEVVSKLKEYKALIVGTPTWNTGADTERSGTGWDEIYYEGPMDGLDIKGKKVAVFGLGDSVSYAENYADATGELHDVFQNKLGCVMVGYTSTDGYMHTASKSILSSDDSKFCGLLLDAVNQPDLTETRVKNWVKQILDEGLLDDKDSSSSTATTTVTVQQHVESIPVQHIEKANGVSVGSTTTTATTASSETATTKVLEQQPNPIEDTIKVNEEEKNNNSISSPTSSSGYKPFYNPKTKKNNVD